jgi:hypothetical protein
LNSQTILKQQLSLQKVFKIQKRKCFIGKKVLNQIGSEAQFFFPPFLFWRSPPAAQPVFLVVVFLRTRKQLYVAGQAARCATSPSIRRMNAGALHRL